MIAKKYRSAEMLAITVFHCMLIMPFFISPLLRLSFMLCSDDQSIYTISCMQPLFHYYSVYKPFQVLSQFSSEEGKKTLGDFFRVEKEVYPVGRLDHDSEGLLLLTDDKAINHRLLHPRWEHEREYWVQVEGAIEEKALYALEKGVVISVNGKQYKTKPCKARRLSATLPMPERNPPIRFRQSIPTSWISLVLSEGKNRQVRKMTAAVGFPTLRLIRYRIGRLTIEGFAPGEMREWKRDAFYKLLFDKQG